MIVPVFLAVFFVLMLTADLGDSGPDGGFCEFCYSILLNHGEQCDCSGSEFKEKSD